MLAVDTCTCAHTHTTFERKRAVRSSRPTRATAPSLSLCASLQGGATPENKACVRACAPPPKGLPCGSRRRWARHHMPQRIGQGQVGDPSDARSALAPAKHDRHQTPCMARAHSKPTLHATQRLIRHLRHNMLDITRCSRVVPRCAHVRNTSAKRRRRSSRRQTRTRRTHR